MKRTLATILLVTAALSLSGQEIRIYDFKAVTGGPVAVVRDFDGNPCAILHMDTSQGGWSFDAGLSGIVDVVPGKNGIDVYVPASARSITVAREGSRPLREWTFPEPLKPGRTYSMHLYARSSQSAEVENPSAKQQPRTVVPSGKPYVPGPTAAPVRFSTSRPSAPTPATVKPKVTLPSLHIKDDYLGWNTGQDLGFSRSFVDAYAGFVQCSDCDYVDETFIGLRYTWLKERVGPYLSLALSTDGCGAGFAGAAWRAFDESRSNIDLHLYGGLGLVYEECLAVELGVRFAWKSESCVSHWDFGLGCQFWGGAVTPTVEVGLYIWGIPVLVCLGLGACAF